MPEEIVKVFNKNKKRFCRLDKSVDFHEIIVF